jgi:type IV secretion system protein VirB1
MDFTTIEQCAPTVAPATMQRIIKVESAFKPHAIGYHITKDGKTYRLTVQPKDKTEAVSWAQWLLDNGYRFDAGAAQVNSNNFKRLGLNAQNIFDACTNIGAGGQILTEFYKGAVRQYGTGQEAIKAAISAYQTGSFTRGYSTGYVQRVSGATSDFSGKVRGKGAESGSKAPMTPQEAPTSVSFN